MRRGYHFTLGSASPRPARGCDALSRARYSADARLHGILGVAPRGRRTQNTTDMMRAATFPFARARPRATLAVAILAATFALAAAGCAHAPVITARPAPAAPAAA